MLDFKVDITFPAAVRKAPEAGGLSFSEGPLQELQAETMVMLMMTTRW